MQHRVGNALWCQCWKVSRLLYFALVCVRIVWPLVTILDVLVFCCCSQSTSRFVMLCVPRCSSAYHFLQHVVISITVTFLSAWSSHAMLLWTLSITRHFHSQLTFFLYSTNWSEWKSQYHSKSLGSQSFLILVWTTTKPLDHICMLLSIELLPHGCLIR